VGGWGVGGGGVWGGGGGGVGGGGGGGAPVCFPVTVFFLSRFDFESACVRCRAFLN
jgi:hypothetical protein